MGNITDVIDGDTFKDEDGRSVRLANTNTPESVHSDDSKNTPAGDAASEFQKDVSGTGTVKASHDYSVDHYGRKVSSVAKTINGVDIDLGLVTLDQGYSAYETRFGAAKDPSLHDAYKEYYSKNAPYQHGEVREQMSSADFDEIDSAQRNFTKIYSDFKNGDATQEEFDQATYNLYKDPKRVAQYRYSAAGWDKKIDADTMGSSDKESIMFALQSSPEMSEQYNRAVRNGHLSQVRAPEKEKVFWEKLGASWSQMSWVSNLQDSVDLAAARTNRAEYDVPKEELLKGAPEEFHAAILEEVDNYGEASGIELRDQVTLDSSNKTITDNMPWYSQVGYGALAMLGDPATYVTGGVTGLGVNAAGQASKFFQLASGIGGTRLWAQGRMFDNVAKATTWAAAGVVEEGLYSLPQLHSDHTFTARDYYMNMAAGAVFGTALGGVVEGTKFSIMMRNNNRKAIRELDEHIVNEKKAKYESELQQEAETEAMNAGNSQQQVNEWVGPVESAKTKREEDHKFTPWAAISKVTTEGYMNAARKVRKLFPKNSHMAILLNKQVGFHNNNPNLSTEMQALSDEINSEILHLASAYPDGNIPAARAQEIREIMFTQKDSDTVNVFDQVLQGKTTNQRELLDEYVNKLENEAGAGNVPPPMTEKQFVSQFSDVINIENKMDVDDWFTLTQGMSPEVSLITDMLAMNKLAGTSQDAQFTDLVHRLNGIAADKLNKADTSADFGGPRGSVDGTETPSITLQKTKPFKKSLRKLSGPEIVAKLKEEGVIQFTGELNPKGGKITTPEWKKRFSELRQSEAEISPEVKRIGDLQSREVGITRTEVDPDGNSHFSVDELKMELDKLKSTPDPTKDQIFRAKIITQQIADADADRVLALDKDAGDADILPKELTRMRSENAFKTPTPRSFKALRTKLRAVNKRNGSTVIPDGVDVGKQKVRLKKVLVRMKKNRKETVKRALKRGSFGDLIDVIRVSDTLAAHNRRIATALKDKDTTVSTDAPDLTKPVTEKEVDTLVNRPEELTPVEQADIQARLDAANDAATEEGLDKVTAGLKEWERNGSKKRFELSTKPTGAIDYIGRMLTKATKSVGEIFLDSKLTSFKYFGATVTEVGRGFGGNAKRAPTAAIIRDAAFKESVVKIVPQYRKMIDAYAASKGKGRLGRLKARERSGAADPLVEEFNRDVFLVQELRRQGKKLPNSVNKSVIDFVDQWDYYMSHNHDELVNAGAAGFTKDRKVKHYIPHIWKQGTFRGAITTHGRAKVEATLSKAYTNLATESNPISKELADKQASDLIDDVLSDDFASIDQFSPTMDARAKARTDLDTTTELDGLSVMDLLDTDVIGVGVKYSNRVGGWVGLAKATDGLLTSQKDIDLFRANMVEEALEAGIKPEKYVEMFDDTIDQLFGRPTKNMFSDTKGLTPELRELKDLAVLTRMGGLGTAQLIETGQVITRNVLSMFSDPKTAKKVLGMGRGEKKDSTLLEEIQSISNITDDLEFLDRQQVHLDQTILDETSKVRQVSLKIANLATGGDAKAEASRGLGKVTGYNMVRRAQTRVAQSSFVLDIANHFVKGTGVMGNFRMADVGLTDTLGKNAAMEKAFKTHAQFDENGVLERLNIGDWDKEVREELQYAMIRDEAQQIQRTHVGELPPWMNKPLMGLIFQFRQMPIVANSKSLGRALAFADVEAVTGVTLNAAMAGLVRYGKFVALGAATGAAIGEFGLGNDPTEEQTQVHKYIAQFGIFGDLHDLVMGRNGITSIEDTKSGWDAVKGQVPVLGLMNDYYEAGRAGVKGDVRGLVNSAENLVPLSNTAIGEVIQSGLQYMVDKLPTGSAVNQDAGDNETVIYAGEEAIRKVEEQEGKLDAIEKRIVELEGYAEEEYDDDKGVSTSGVGQTGRYQNKSFKESVDIFKAKAKKTFKDFDSYPVTVQAELVQLYYRGDVNPRHNWVKMMNKGNFTGASKELLNHKGYKSRKVAGGDGVTVRLEEASKIIREV